MQRNKTVLFVMAPFVSHLLPTYKIGLYFQERGYIVVYVSTVKCEQHIVQHGFLFQNSAVRDENAKVMKVEDLVSFLVSKYHAALFLVEVSFWSWGLLLQGCRQRFIMIQTWPCCDRAPFLLTEGYRIMQKRNLFTYITNVFSWRKENRRARELLQSGDLKSYYDELVIKAGLDPSGKYISRQNRIGYFRILHVPEIILYPLEFDFPRRKNKNTWFAGPFIDITRPEVNGSFPVLPDSPLFYCSLGSMTNLYKNSRSFYDRMIAAFTQRPGMTLVMSVGNVINEIDLSGLPSNIHICAYAPQLHLLKKAAVFITQGGAGSVKEAIHFGVPMVIYPWVTAKNSDQLGIADRVIYHHLGVLGDIENDQPADILKRIDLVHGNKKIMGSMHHMQSVFQRYAGNEKNIIDAMIRFAE
jgi:UDP:flavonoid glycosyltransferase YjiC (YdhE family)